METKKGEVPKEKVNRVVEVGEFKVDLDLLPPLTMGDKVQLFKKHGVDWAKLKESTPVEDAALVLYVLKKLEPQVTEEMVLALPIKRAQFVLGVALIKSNEVDTVFTPPSTPSGGTTDGDGVK